MPIEDFLKDNLIHLFRGKSVPLQLLEVSNDTKIYK